MSLTALQVNPHPPGVKPLGYKSNVLRQLYFRLPVSLGLKKCGGAFSLGSLLLILIPIPVRELSGW